MEPEKEVVLPRLARKRKHEEMAAYKKILIAVFFLLCASLGFMAQRYFADPLIPVAIAGESPTQYVAEDILNLLLIGVDQRENEPSRADTIILASIDLTEKKINLLSIPRDTRVKIAGTNELRKINYSHTVGGAELTVETVEDFLELPVHYYIETNFDGFEGIIDILGGITLNVEQRMYYPEEEIDLYAGLQKLAGHDALSYVRWRSDGRGDIGRIERQQKFFRALVDQAVSFSTIWKLPDLTGELSKHLQTDMSLQKMIILANKLKDIQNVSLETAMVPGAPDDINYGASYWIADTEALTEILKGIYGEQ